MSSVQNFLAIPDKKITHFILHSTFSFSLSIWISTALALVAICPDGLSRSKLFSIIKAVCLSMLSNRISFYQQSKVYPKNYIGTNVLVLFANLLSQLFLQSRIPNNLFAMTPPLLSFFLRLILLLIEI